MTQAKCAAFMRNAVPRAINLRVQTRLLYLLRGSRSEYDFSVSNVVRTQRTDGYQWDKPRMFYLRNAIHGKQSPLCSRISFHRNAKGKRNSVPRGTRGISDWDDMEY